MERIDPHVAVRKISPFQSARTAKISLITIHATESTEEGGAVDLAAIGSWFSNPAAQVSAHVCTDASLGQSGRYVVDGRKAWHCAAYNSASLGIEQIGHTAQTKWAENEYHETARWVARWSLMHGVPIRHGHVANGRVLVSGIVRHSDLGAAGGGHDDPGPHYDLSHMMDIADYYKTKLRARG